MKRMKYGLPIIVILIALVALAGVPAMAQDDSGVDYPINTITVTGSGSAAGSPDIANMEIGVETADPDVSAAFNQTNATIQSVIDALVEIGVAREDIRTTGLNIYQDRPGGPDPMLSEASATYRVSNQVRVTIRDISLVSDAINAAVGAGANNIYGLQFGIDNQDALEADARADAISNARERAQQYADLIGAELGDVVVINENFGGGFGAFDVANFSTGFGGGGAPIEPGQLSVSVQVQVTFAINR
jgi:uncharacterized protein YggE